MSKVIVDPELYEELEQEAFVEPLTLKERLDIEEEQEGDSEQPASS